MANLESLVYLGAFILLWLILIVVEPLKAGQIVSTAMVLLVGAAVYYLLARFRKGGAVFKWWQATLVGLLLAEVYFAIGFWSTPVRNKALILAAVVFVFGQWFDRIEVKWLSLFLIVLLAALLIVPFQAL